MMEDKVTKIKTEAAQIRKKWKKITKQMEWYLDYQIEMLSIKSSLLPCCTSYVRLQDQTPTQFRRGFKTLTKEQRAQFYLMSVKYIDKNINSHNYLHKHTENKQNRQHKIFKILIKDKSWFKNLTQASAELLKPHKKIRVQHLYQIQLCKYIIRSSSNKSLVNCIILQSIQPFSSSQTIRIFIKDNDFLNIQKQIKQCWLQAQQQRINFMMMDSIYTSKKIIQPFSTSHTLQKQQKILESKIYKQQINIQQKNKHKNHKNETMDQMKNSILKKHTSLNVQKIDFVEIQKQILFYSVQGSINTIDEGAYSDEEQKLSIQYKYIPNKINKHEKKNEVFFRYNEGQISFIDDDYLQHCYQQGTNQKRDPVLYKKPSGHIIFGNQWTIRSNGDLAFTNYQKMKIQRSIFKKVIKKIGSNLLTGKGFNLSLPVVILGTNTHLQKIVQGYIYAPRFLQRAAMQEDPVERMRQVVCFLVGVAINFVQTDKPFNPVLGETYQGLIDGCPVYAEQISHHPPISSVLFYGRGYRIYGNFEPTVEIGMNKLTGINKGTHLIQFQDGTTIKCENALAVMNGVAFGQRKLQFIKKSEIIDKSNRIICQIYWGKQNDINILSKSHDYVKAKIMKIKKRVNIQKIKNLKKNDIEEQYDDIYGQWTGHIYNNGQLIFDIKKDQPYQIEDYHPCLPSDSRFRKDLIHMKDNNYQQAQICKDQIQQAQRYYRKLRKNNIQ